jgi:pimeloyl-ACP methyl ester carboxylesterase
MFLIEEGAGNAVVLIHGFCENHEVWRGVARQLSQHYRVLLPDLPGFGRSPLLPRPFTLQDVARQVLNRLTEVGASSVVAVGHSLGGYVALAMARLEPQRVKGIALVHSTALPDSPERRENRNRVMAFIEQHGTEPFIQSFFQSLFVNAGHPALPQLVETARHISAETLVAYTQAMRDRSDQMPFLMQYPGEVLFLGGAKDPLIPAESLLNQAAQLPAQKVRTEILANAAHMGLLENQQETGTILLEWLAGVWAGQSNNQPVS